MRKIIGTAFILIMNLGSLVAGCLTNTFSVIVFMTLFINVIFVLGTAIEQDYR